MTNNEKLNLSNMQKIREKRNITQVKLSLIVGISQQSITYSFIMPKNLLFSFY